ncbi:regenerating islet-derived protein 4-like [Lissotriton helveticus]
MHLSTWVSLCLLSGAIGSTLIEGASVRSSCPPGWFFYKSHCYGFTQHALPWSDAEFECHSYGTGAHLASILDDAEARIIGSHISAYQKDDGVWVGLHDPAQNGRWKWNDGALYSYKAWKSGAPQAKKGNEFCVVLISGSGFKKWKNARCGASKTFLCKYKP